MSRRPVASVLTLGCKLNLADSEAVAGRLGAAGYDVVVNTCSVTHAADRKSRRLIRAARRLSPSAPIAVTGCYPRSAGTAAVEALGADFVAGTTADEHERLVARLVVTAPSRNARGLHTRAFVKAQEGCNDVCAFSCCARGAARSRARSRTSPATWRRPTHAVPVRSCSLAPSSARGVATSLRRSLPAICPRDLIAGVLARTEVPRLRFSSLQPQDITPLLALWDDPRLMPHFHLALQSGSDAVLARMRRRYDSAAYREALGRIRAAVPDAAVTTDVIAGFPGEREADFAATLALCEEAAFARVHAFPYWPRARTAAASMPNQVPVEVRKARMARLRALADALAAVFRARFTGTVRPVLWEERRTTPAGPRWHGLTDNYLSVYGESDEALAGRMTPAVLGGPFADGLAARQGGAS